MRAQVAALRAGRKEYVPDERYTQVLAMIRGGTFGWADYFSPLINSLEGVAGGDYYLCANDFVPYIEMQVCFVRVLFVTRFFGFFWFFSRYLDRG